MYVVGGRLKFIRARVAPTVGESGERTRSPMARFDNHEYPQIIPEPDDVTPGALAPWSSLDPRQRRGLTLELVEQRLRDYGRHAEVASALENSAEMGAFRDMAPRAPVRRSAVLVALFEEEGESHLILTRRSLTLRHHRGEIALPGGRSDPGETPVHTALREAREEVGLAEADVTPVGWLNPLVSLASNSAIWPVVGFLARRPVLRADPSEVERVFTVSLAELAADGAFLEERWRRHEPRPGADAEGFFPIYFFRVPGDLIWGATARVLTELLCVICGVAWPDADRKWA